MSILSRIRKVFASNSLAGDLVHRRYIVVKGDTLSSIAARHLGGAEQWRLIQEMNDIKNPNLIKPGQVLKLPPL